MAGAQIPTSSTILNSILGYQGVSFTEFATSAQSLIAAGSKVEIGGSWFTFASNDTPNASSWTAITTANTAYITLTPSGTAGSQILTSKYSDSAPAWSTAKQGWYESVASVIRYIGGVTKTSETQYDDAFIIPTFQERTYDSLTIRDTITGNITGNITGSHIGAINESYSSATEDVVFDGLSGAIASGQSFLCSGAISPTSGHTIIMNQIQRYGSTIQVGGIATDDYSAEDYEISDGDATVIHYIAVAF